SAPRLALVGQPALMVFPAPLSLPPRQPWLLVVAAMIGNLAVSTGETGPFLALEQVIVTRATGRAHLTMALAFYNLAGYAAAGLGAAAVTRAGAAPRSPFTPFLVSGLVPIAPYALPPSERPPSTHGRPAAG